MSEAPLMPMYWDAYLADTTHLTTEEHGAYLLLLAAMWRRGGCVPDDDADNARILGLTKAKWRRVKTRLTPLLIIEDDKISQKKLQKTWKKTQETILKNRENGAKGGRPKRNENNDLAKATGSVSVNPNKTIPEPEPEPLIKEDTNVSSKTKTRRRKSRIPEGAVCSDDFLRIAEAEGHDEREALAQFERFKSNALAHGRQYVDWNAAWRNWFRSTYFRPVFPKHVPITGGQANDQRSRKIAADDELREFTRRLAQGNDGC